MEAEFNSDEIFEIAEQIERNGARFYESAAGRFQDAKSRELLLNLARMEKEHELVFSRMRAQFLRHHGKGDSRLDEEAALYLKSFAENKVFDENDETPLKGEERLDDILRTALRMEKESIAFYLGMQQMVPDSWGRSHVGTIIREEMEHVSLLTTIRKKFQA